LLHKQHALWPCGLSKAITAAAMASMSQRMQMSLVRAADAVHRSVLPQPKVIMTADPKPPTMYSNTKNSSSFSRMTSRSLMMDGWLSRRSETTCGARCHYALGLFKHAPDLVITHRVFLLESDCASMRPPASPLLPLSAIVGQPGCSSSRARINVDDAHSRCHAGLSQADAFLLDGNRRFVMIRRGATPRASTELRCVVILRLPREG